ncbi:MAG: hypothetical protein ACOX1Q_09705 [Eubacteriales bacterium]
MHQFSLHWGFGEWRASVSLLTGLIAKEAVVSTMGILYGLERSVAESGGLVPIIRQAFTPASALAFMTFTLSLCPLCLHFSHDPS